MGSNQLFDSPMIFIHLRFTGGIFSLNTQECCSLSNPLQILKFLKYNFE